MELTGPQLYYINEIMKKKSLYILQIDEKMAFVFFLLDGRLWNGSMRILSLTSQFFLDSIWILQFQRCHRHICILRKEFDFAGWKYSRCVHNLFWHSKLFAWVWFAKKKRVFMRENNLDSLIMRTNEWR